jgi:hypothetical protein
MRRFYLGQTLGLATALALTPCAHAVEVNQLHLEALDHYQHQLDASTEVKLDAPTRDFDPQAINDRLQWQLRNLQAPNRTATATSTLELTKLQRLQSWLDIANGEVRQFQASGEKPIRNVNLAGLAQSEIRNYIQAPSCNEAVRFSSGTAGLMLQAGQAQWLEVETRLYESLLISTAGSEVDTKIEVFADRCPDANTVAEQIHDDDLGLFAEYRLAKSDRPKRKFLKIAANTTGAAQVRASLATGMIRGSIATVTIINPSFSVQAYRRVQNNFQFLASIQTFSTNYEITVDEGDVYLFAGESSDSVLGRVYPNAPCYRQPGDAGCDVTSALPIRVNPGTATSNINFTLTPGAQILGRVSGTPISTPLGNGATVELRRVPDGSFSTSSFLDNVGRYEFRNLPPGTYKAFVRGGFFRSQLYQGVNCAEFECDIALGTPVTLTDGQVRSDINFNPERYPSISGRITVEGAGSVSNTFFIVSAFNLDTLTSTEGYANSEGDYQIPLRPGRYALAFFGNGYVPELYDNIVCMTASFMPCSNFAEGAVLTLSQQSQVRANATLTPLGSMLGRVVDDLGMAVANAEVLVCRAGNGAGTCQSVASTSTNSAGDYTLRALPAGSYYVIARSNQHLDQVHPNIDCQPLPNIQCDPQLVGATPILISNGMETSGINFILPRAARIAGSCLGCNNQFFLPIRVYKTGVITGPLDTITRFTQNRYVIDDLGPGDYRLLLDANANPNNAVFSQVFADRTCAGTAALPCTIVQGDVVSLAPGQQTNNIDFNLVSRRLIKGRVTSLSTGAPIVNAVVDVWVTSPPQLPFRTRSTFTDIAGNYNVNLEDSFFSSSNIYVTTDAREIYLNQIHRNVQCPVNTSAYLGTCDFTGGTTISLPAAFPGQIGNVDFVLRDAVNNELFFRSGFE